jgi:hypothetical protein
VLGVEEAVELLLEIAHRPGLDVIEVPVGHDPQDGCLTLHRKRAELRLLDDLGDALAAVELVTRGLVQVRRELGEGGQLAELGQIQLERAGDLLHGLVLGR